MWHYKAIYQSSKRHASIKKYIQTKHFFLEIINTVKQSIAKIFDGTTFFVSCKTYTAMRYKKTTRHYKYI